VFTDTNSGTFTTATVQAQMRATVTFSRGSVSTVYIFSRAGA
jgi:hypothetical protein